jgi:hypothetical protein
VLWPFVTVAVNGYPHASRVRLPTTSPRAAEGTALDTAVYRSSVGGADAPLGGRRYSVLLMTMPHHNLLAFYNRGPTILSSPRFDSRILFRHAS